jgi:putative (di)nucleoside polyphosphate hydrolase
MASKLEYRLNVAGILQSSDGRVLICERLGQSNAWQFPQGGVDAGETLEQALFRELEEEIGVPSSAYQIRTQSGPYRYTYEKGLIRGFAGKDQHFFLVDYSGALDAIRLDLPHPEFQNYAWIEPAHFRMEWLPVMKKEMYRAVFRDLLGTALAE